jgi:ferredoxin-type protein NapG
MTAPEGSEKMPERRQFLTDLLRGAGAAAVGGLAWAGFLDGKKAYPTVLRPPGAVKEEKFLVLCTKCGLCAEACPYKALVIAKPGDERPVGTPYFIMRENPCKMCRDIPCAVACPTGALDSSLMRDKDEQGRDKLNINLAKIGLAVIDRETCIAYWGIQCDACYRVCPVIDKALTVERPSGKKL